MKLCDEYLRVEDLQRQAKLYGEALRVWQLHLQGCTTCAEQQRAAQELQFVLCGEAVPQVQRGFADAVLQQVRATQRATSQRPRLPRRTRLWLAVNWAVVMTVCAALAATIHPTDDFVRSPVYLLPLLFLLASAALAFLLSRSQAVRPPAAGSRPNN